MTLRNKVTRTVFYSYISIVTIFAVIRMLGMFKVLKLSTTGGYILDAFIQLGLMLALPIIFFSVRHKQKPKDTLNFFGYKKISFKAILIAIAMGVLVYILNIFVSNFFAMFLNLLGYKNKATGTSGAYPLWQLFLNLFCTAILPAICEESAHRGLVLKGLNPLGRKRAVIISSLLFGLTHMNINQVFYATIIGLLLGYITSGVDSIYPAMIIHFMNNALSTLMTYSARNGYNWHFIHNFLNANLQTRPIVAVLFSIAIVVLAGVLLWLLTKLLFKETVNKKTVILQNEIFKEVAKQTYMKEIEQVAEGVATLPEEKKVSFEEFNQIYMSKGVEMGHFSLLESELIFNQEPYKMDKVTKALMITCFALSSIITIFTFIWGGI